MKTDTQNPLISVIVPVFNTGPYLTQCLDSILSQTYKPLDVILINDGSTDGSAAICQSYADKEERVRLINKPLGGGGVGAARNTALPLVRGDYLLFVDHDDWLEVDHVEQLYQAARDTNSDIAVANFVEFMEETQHFRFHVSQKDYFREVYHPKDWFQKQYQGQFAFSQCFTVPWGKLYKTSLFDQVSYPEDQAVEDDYTTWKIYLMANQIVYDNRPLYCHRKHSDSVTKTVDLTSVYPLRSIEERVTMLALIGFELSEELTAYRWRLNLHLEHLLASGNMQEYKRCRQLLTILNRWSHT